jgi:sigma-B regulation protein RsbU (phosphoserine phosphatase)
MEEIGGDFYDFIKFEDKDLLGIIISDVSGHGVPAALITAMFKGYIEEAGELKLHPSKLLTQLNIALQPITGMNFITVFYGIFNRKNSTLKFVNAGHTIPFIIKNQQISSLLGIRSVPIAIFSNEHLAKHKKTFVENTITLEKGSRIILYTDGLTEARNISTPLEDFERTSLFTVLTEKTDDSPKAFIKRIYKELIKYTGNESLEDDVCIISIDV